ncbi:MAG: hypothetical protein EBR51_06750 [Gammaproteobacteria bacterium]|nr:hypothetical protein [Gammaproteobacteria bacterium]
MAQPFSYMLNVPNPAEAVTGGLQQGIQLGTMMERADLMAAQRQQTEIENRGLLAKQARATEFQNELGKLSSEGFSARGLNELMIRYPEAVEQLKTPFANLSTQERETKVAELQPIIAALNAGDRVNAAELIDQQVKAYEAAGNKRSADAAAAQRDMVLFGDLNAAQTSLNTAVAMAMGPEKYNETFGKLEDERRKRMLEDSTNLKEYSDAKIAEAKAKFAEIREQLEVDKLKPKPMGVGGAAAGPKPLSLKDQLGVEGKLRDDFNGAMKPITEMRRSFERLNSAQDDAAGDLALIFNYMKMLDPGSAVREGEFANAQNAAGVPDQIRNQWNKLQSGERLNPNQRASFRSQGAKIYEGYKKDGDRIRATYTNEAKRIGIEPSAIFLSAPEEQPEAPKAAAPAGPQVSKAPPMATTAAPAVSGGGSWAITSVRQ